MIKQLNINTDIYKWAIKRAGMKIGDIAPNNPKLLDWMAGTKEPTIKQLQAFSKKVKIPYGYFFLDKLPEEKLPIPFFRTEQGKTDKVSLNVYDTIQLMIRRQDWLRDYLQDNNFRKLEFVGSHKKYSDVHKIVQDIKQTFKLKEEWASGFNTWQEALSHLSAQIEDKGIAMSFNSVVGNNPHRKIKVEECRGFVLADEWAPLIFINSSDSKSGQMFTIAHELAHVWTGQSAGFDFRMYQPAQDQNEILCDKIAAEFLVPAKSFLSVWKKLRNIKKTAKHFKVSEIVIARRALDLGKVDKNDFFQFYNDYKTRLLNLKSKQTSGGDFYATQKKRLGTKFSAHIKNAVKSGNLLYREAYRLTNLNGDTFNKFISKL